MIRRARRAYADFLRKVFAQINRLPGSLLDHSTVQNWLREVRETGNPVEKLFKGADSSSRPSIVDWQNALSSVSGYKGQWKYRNLQRPEYMSHFDLEMAKAYNIVPVYLQGNQVYFAVVYPLVSGHDPELQNYLQNIANDLVQSEKAAVNYLIALADEVQRTIYRYSHPGGFRQGVIDL